MSKLKFLLEEIPTIEHMKLRRPDLYEHWNCQMCYQHKESFEHVWICSQHTHILNGIIYRIKHLLISLVRKFSTSDDRISLRHLSHSHLWSPVPSPSQLTFIDLIKGVVPSFLVRIIDNFVKDKLITRSILSLFFNNLYLDIMERLWKPRCEVVLRMEQHCNINRRVKKQLKPSGVPRINNLNRQLRSQSYSDNTASSFDQEGLVFSINTGLSWSDFMMGDNIHVTSAIALAGVAASA